MNVFINGNNVNPRIVRPPHLNYGQMQRWSEFVELRYTIELPVQEFEKQIGKKFDEFRKDEMENYESDEDYPYLDEFAEKGFPQLSTLLKDDFYLLEQIIVDLLDLEILECICDYRFVLTKYWYSINSVDSVKLHDNIICIEGIAFKSDYLYHCYDSALTKRYALLKTDV